MTGGCILLHAEAATSVPLGVSAICAHNTTPEFSVVFSAELELCRRLARGPVLTLLPRFPQRRQGGLMDRCTGHGLCTFPIP